MVVLVSMLSLTCHLADLCYFTKITDMEIFHFSEKLYSQSLEEGWQCNKSAYSIMYVHKTCCVWIRYKNGGER